MDTTTFYKPEQQNHFVCEKCHHQLTPDMADGDIPAEPDFKFCPYCGLPVRNKDDIPEGEKPFDVTYGVEGKYTISVTAKSIKEAVNKADKLFDNINSGDIKLEYHTARKVTEENNKTTYL